MKRKKTASTIRKVKRSAKSPVKGLSPLLASKRKKKMKFYEDVHKYIDEDVEYIPVTYFLKTFQHWVDWDKEAEKKAKKLGITKEEMLKQWKDKANAAAEKGTAFHKMMEDQYLQSAGNLTVADTQCGLSSCPTISGVKEDKSMKLENNTVYTEKMIWSKKYKLCGTADLVEVVNGKINVKDYKTNAKLDMESWKHPILGSKKLKFPVNGLDDCNFNLYQLQVNVYMYMLLQQNRGLKMGNMEILHVVFDDFGGHEIKKYKVKDLQKEVKSMMEYFKEKKKL